MICTKVVTSISGTQKFEEAIRQEFWKKAWRWDWYFWEIETCSHVKNQRKYLLVWHGFKNMDTILIGHSKETRQD